MESNGGGRRRRDARPTLTLARPPMDLAGALEATIAALRAENRLTDAHLAYVEACRVLVVAVSADPSNASLWREYRAMLGALVGLDRGVSEDDGARLIDSLRTPVGDAAQSGA